MSHFTVAVFHEKDQDIDDLLAPFDENMRVDPYMIYTKEEAIKYVRENYNTAGQTDEECWKFLSEDYITDDEGNIFSTYNPNSKWDWWIVGGRWFNMLKANGEKCNTARVGDIDFSLDEEEYKRALRFWDVIVEGKPKEEGEEIFTIYSPSYYKDYFGDRETFAVTHAIFSTFAVILPDGTWHEESQMGWFGISDASPDEKKNWFKSYKERFIDTANPEWFLTIVDCHI